MRKAGIVLSVSLAVAAFASYAQTPPKSFIGTVSAFRPESAELEVKPDAGAPAAAPILVKLLAGTIALRVPPGSTDLKTATAIQVTDVQIGDKVLVSFETGTSNARRIVDMSLADIAKRNEADRLEWTRRGVAGVVTARKGNEITLKIRGVGSETQAVVTVTDKTGFKRYSSESVKFADAKPSQIADIAVGDQLRARGQKSEDGSKVTAEEVVFGTFVTRGGTVTEVHPDTKEVTLKELGTGKPLLVKLTADSQVKRVPDLTMFINTIMAARGGAGAGAGAGAGRGMMGGRGDMSQMLDRLPQTKLEDLTIGDTVVVSSTKGAKSDEVTAITLLSNADQLIRIASMMSQASALRGGVMAGAAAGAMAGGGPGAAGAMSGDLSGLGLGLSGVMQ